MTKAASFKAILSIRLFTPIIAAGKFVVEFKLRKFIILNKGETL
jgi:hypothetical protein